MESSAAALIGGVLLLDEGKENFPYSWSWWQCW